MQDAIGQLSVYLLFFSFLNKEKLANYRIVVSHCVVKLAISNAFEQQKRNLIFIIFSPNLGPLVAVLKILAMLLMNHRQLVKLS